MLFSINKLCVIQQQVPLLLPCVNFAQITIPSLTYQEATFLIKDIFKQEWCQQFSNRTRKVLYET